MEKKNFELEAERALTVEDLKANYDRLADLQTNLYKWFKTFRKRIVEVSDHITSDRYNNRDLCILVFGHVFNEMWEADGVMPTMAELGAKIQDDQMTLKMAFDIMNIGNTVPSSLGPSRSFPARALAYGFVVALMDANNIYHKLENLEAMKGNDDFFYALLATIDYENSPKLEEEGLGHVETLVYGTHDSIKKL